MFFIGDLGVLGVFLWWFGVVLGVVGWFGVFWGDSMDRFSFMVLLKPGRGFVDYNHDKIAM